MALSRSTLASMLLEANPGLVSAIEKSIDMLEAGTFNNLQAIPSS